MGKANALLWVGLVAVAAWLAGVGRDNAETTEAAGPESSPVLSPSEALAVFDLEDGFTISLFASEPMIEDPVAMAFDADGRLFVVEMQSYMPDIAGDGELVPTSRVMVLEDTDGDGQADKATPFLEGLVLPRAILPCYGGLLLIEPPNLLFCRDTTGDGRADEKTVVLTGFDGLVNPEHAGNALRYGLDNWVHLSQFNIAFRFDGKRAITRKVPRVGQWGMTLDEAGRLYYTPNSETLRMDLLPSHYAARAPGGLRGLYQRVGRDTATFPARPTTGINRGYRPNMLRDDGTLRSVTAACGPSLYTSHAWPGEFHLNAFICEPSGNLVKRMVRSEQGGRPFWTNAMTGTEFLRSTDERFRPVDSTIGPDGALYICDMYRGIIQHKTYLTEYLAGEIRERGLDKPIGLGRIWRITRKGTNTPVSPRMSASTDAQLVDQLGHSDLWWRLTAQRLLVERRAVGTADAVRTVLTSSPDPLARLHALWTLDGLGIVTTSDVLTGLADEDTRVRAAACQVAETADVHAVAEPLAEVAGGGDRLTAAQALLSLGQLGTEQAREALTEMVRTRADNALIRSAAVNSLAGHEPDALRTLLADAAWPVDASDRAALAELVDGALRSPRAREALALAVTETDRSPARAEIIFARLGAMQRLGSRNPRRLTLTSEPRGWAAFLDSGSGPLADRARASDAYLNWPGRPAPQAAPLTTRQRTQIARGKRLFIYCQACHGPEGAGSGSQYPPLAGSPRVLGPPEDFARVLLHGLEGPLARGEVTYDDAMPPAPFADDGELAAIMSFVRSAFGNNAGPVSAELVTSVRTTEAGRTRPWRDEELTAEAQTQQTEASAKWTPLFDGQTLEGWQQRGGQAHYRVEEGVIIGETRANQPNTFLCTTSNYADFELELEFMVDDELNSGIQIRSASKPDYRNGAVHGYQVEIDPSDRSWTAGLYEESARGWLDPLDDNQPAREAFIHGDWNHLRVLAVGHHIQTWLNGVPAADLVDEDGALEGFIALQVHGVGGREETLRVRWRNIRLREIEPDSGAEP
jgi:mono/diheme cytochrome c family protein/glucose/arabinose dehydrogenase